MLLFGVLFALVLPVFAQLGTVKDYRHEISLGYGFLAVSGTDFDLDYPYYHEVDNIGAFFAAYTHLFDSIIGVGITYCYDPRIINYYGYSKDRERFTICNLDESCHSIMVHAKFNCFRYKFLLIYGKFDAGICFWDYHLKEYHPENYEVRLPEQHCCFAWQYALGIEVSIGHWGLFAQTGIGMEGNTSLGINYKFNENKSKNK